MATKDTPILELGEFITQKDKYRGYIHTYLLGIKTKLDKSTKEKITVGTEPIYSFDEIAHNINDIMVLQKLSSFTDEVLCGIVLCIIALLHDVNIMNKKEQFGKLVFAMQNDQIVLFSIIRGKNKTDITVPLLQVKNIFCKLGRESNEPLLFNEGVKIKNIHNKLIVNFN